MRFPYKCTAFFVCLLKRVFAPGIFICRTESKRAAGMENKTERMSLPKPYFLPHRIVYFLPERNYYGYSANTIE